MTGFRITNLVFAVARARTPTLATARRGTTFLYSLSEPATVRIVISALIPGRWRGRNCVALSKRLRHAKRCARSVPRGTLIRASRRGANAIRFSGRMGSKPLVPGHYEATLTATSPSQETSKPQGRTFTVIRV